MASLLQIKARVLNVNIRAIAETAIEETKQDIIDRQQEQLRYGFNAKGQKIGKYKNEAYARKKNAMNPLAGLGNVDLKLEGNFVKAIKVDVTPDVYRIESTDSKSAELTEKYGEDIMGLDADHKKGYVNQDLRPVFMKKVREKIKL